MNDEHIYWLFSSAAQSIATFVAFLLAGYTLVHAMMDSIQQRDDTLEEIHSHPGWHTGAPLTIDAHQNS
jgi:hypothetical protein